VNAIKDTCMPQPPASFDSLPSPGARSHEEASHVPISEEDRTAAERSGFNELSEENEMLAGCELFSVDIGVPSVASSHDAWKREKPRCLPNREIFTDRSVNGSD